ncbi:MAG TPA: 3-hydroxyacyl-ACP dehydratase FabZ [bacterium]
MSSKLAAAPQQLDFEQIKRIIPQRFPFLMLDRVIEIVPGERIIGLKNLTGNEWFYQGHFPKRAVTPGAMICEAVAQAGIVFFHLMYPDHQDVTYLLGGIKIRFREPVWPGEQLRIEVSPVKVTSTAGILSAIVRVEDRVVAKGEFALATKDNDLL